MVKKPLLQIEWKQQKWLLVVGFLIISFLVPISTYIDYMSWKEYGFNSTFKMYFGGNVSMYMLIAVGFAATLAITQLGSERGKGSLEFQFTLPYSRGEIFTSKLIVGLIWLIGGVFLSFILTALILEFSGAEHVYFYNFYVHFIVTAILAYTLIFAAGGITGHLIAQGLTAFSLSVLPIALYLTLGNNIHIFLEKFFIYSSLPYSDMIIYFTPIYYVFYGGFFSEPVEVNYYIPIILSILFTTIGYFSFVHQPFERNGSFFLWKQLNRPVQILVIVVGTLGFSAFGYHSTNYSLGGYLGGGLVGAFIGFIICYFTIFRKSKQS